MIQHWHDGHEPAVPPRSITTPSMIKPAGKTLDDKASRDDCGSEGTNDGDHLYRCCRVSEIQVECNIHSMSLTEPKFALDKEGN